MLMRSFFQKKLSALLLMTALLAGFSSCKKDKDDVPGPNPPAEQRIKQFTDGDEFVRFDYNAAGAVSTVTINSDVNTGGVPTAYAVSYAGNQISSLQNAAGEKIIPIYEDGKLKRADMLIADERIGFTNYYYENNKLKGATIYFGSDDDFNPFLGFEFVYDAAANLTQTATFIANGTPGLLVRSGHVNYQYDQKSNPLYAHRDLLLLFWQSVSSHNVTVEDHFDADQQPEDKYTYNYTYNAKGLPTAAVVTQGLPGNPAVTSEVQFSYQ